MKRILLALFPIYLMGMDGSQSPTLRPLSPAVIESHYTTEDFRIINVTPEEERIFHQSIQAAHERERQYRARDVEAQQQAPEQRVQSNSLSQAVANNKTLILSNLTTAILGATVTLIVHFTAAK